MATLNSTQYGNQIGSAGTSPAASYPTPMSIGGKLRIAVAQITTGTAVTANDIWNLAKLPLGAKVLPALSWVASEQETTSTGALVIDIGYSSNTDALSDALAIDDAGEKRFSEGSTVAVGDLSPTTLDTDADTLVYATVKTSTALAGSKSYTFFIAYLSE